MCAIITPRFQKYARTEHMRRYKVLLKIETAFPESTDVDSVMHHILIRFWAKS
ncbi:MAG: hypothetical protein ACLR56_11965 [Oscillospiraceae bacterium]